MKLIIIHKEPIIERIPNLKAFIVYASLLHHDITIITTKNQTYPEPTFLTKNVKYIAIKERSKKFQIPTYIRFYSVCLIYLFANISRKYSLILAGKYAIVLGSLLKLLKLKEYCSFIIEYPEFNPRTECKLTLGDKMELYGVMHSKFIITHDKLHADFISDNMKIKEIDYATIPNGTIGVSNKIKSFFLHDRLNISKERKILLHSGGFGPWFDSDVLSEQSISIPNNYDLVFHVSHDISKDDYYKEFLINRLYGDRALFSMDPVSTECLDLLISSAYIGIAWYSIPILGYRATMIGLAAGKIGNYLKCGIPVIVPAYDSLLYITDFSCGVQISNLKDLNSAILKIEKNYSFYSDNAMKCYDELWNTEKYCDNLLIKLALGK